jgi:hypothetical protein
MPVNDRRRASGSIRPHGSIEWTFPRSSNAQVNLSGLVFAVTAQAALAGVLAPVRNEIGGWWTVQGGSARDLLAALHLDRRAGLVSARCGCSRRCGSPCAAGATRGSGSAA